MTISRKPIFAEGQRLTPHHLQQLDNYHEELLNSRLETVIPFQWGVLDLRFNHNAIKNGLLEIHSGTVVFPDGTLLQMPSPDSLPDSRTFTNYFTSLTKSLDVFLGVPIKRTNGLNFDRLNVNELNTRYKSYAASVVDETTGEKELPITCARTNIRILLGNENRDGYSVIKIGEIERSIGGQFSISEKFISPLLNIHGDQWLSTMVNQLLEIMIAKGDTLRNMRRQRSNNLADFTNSETALFFLLNTINISIPVLANLKGTTLCHPRELYRELVQIVGSLLTFTLDELPQDIVPYDHHKPYFTFHTLYEQIRRLLDTVIPNKFVIIPLEDLRNSVFAGKINDDRLLQAPNFYIGLSCKMSEPIFISSLPRKIKISAKDDIDSLISVAIPGVSVSYVAQPSYIPIRNNYHYFKLEPHSEFWSQIAMARDIAIYLPKDEFPDINVEMYAIKP